MFYWAGVTFRIGWAGFASLAFLRFDRPHRAVPSIYVGLKGTKQILLIEKKIANLQKQTSPQPTWVISIRSLLLSRLGSQVSISQLDSSFSLGYQNSQIFI